VLVLLAVFVATLAGFLVLTDPSTAGRPTTPDPSAAQTHGEFSTDASARRSSEDPSLPAAADVLPLNAPPSASAAPTF